MAPRENTAHLLARLVAEYTNAPLGTSLKAFVDGADGYGSYGRIQALLRGHPEVRAQVDRIRVRLMRDGLAPRKPRQPQEATEAPAPIVTSTEPGRHLVEAPERVLSEREASWLVAYQSNGFQAIEACQVSGLTFEELEAALKEQSGPFIEGYRRAMRMRERTLEDAYVKMSLAGQDATARAALADNIKRLLPKSEAVDSASIYTIGMQGASQRWGQRFPGR